MYHAPAVGRLAKHRFGLASASLDLTNDRTTGPYVADSSPFHTAMRAQRSPHIRICWLPISCQTSLIGEHGIRHLGTAKT